MDIIVLFLFTLVGILSSIFGSLILLEFKESREPTEFVLGACMLLLAALCLIGAYEVIQWI